MGVRASCVFLVYLTRRLNLVTCMLKWRLSSTVLFTCMYAAATGKIDCLSKLSRFAAYSGVSEYGQLRMETQVHSGGEPVVSPLLGAPDGGFHRKCFPTKKSSNRFPNFWLLSKTGFLSQLIEHKLQLTLQGLTCILGSSQLYSYLGAF